MVMVWIWHFAAASLDDAAQAIGRRAVVGDGHVAGARAGALRRRRAPRAGRYADRPDIIVGGFGSSRRQLRRRQRERGAQGRTG